MAEIKLNGVTKKYADGTLAVDHLDLEAGDGEFVVLVGPSGCGKTSALRMIAGLEDISAGTISVGDRVVNDVPAQNRDIAMIFQNYALYPHMNVFENIGFGLKMRGMPKDEIRRRVEEAARVLGLADQLKKRPRHLSGGQRQRVAMGRAIVREPQAFLMDEPLSNLDAKLRVQMRAELARIQRDLSVTTIFVTHDQSEAMTLGDRVCVLRGGLLQQVDRPQVLYNSPRNMFVAGFIGSPAMNFAEATIVTVDGKSVVKIGSHMLGVSDEVLAARPSLRAYRNRPVVVGVRPEDMEDASLQTDAPPDTRISVRSEIIEDMGAEIYVHFDIGARSATNGLFETGNGGEHDIETAESGKYAEEGVWIARVGRNSAAREGEPLELAVDCARLHFFDPATGDAIYNQLAQPDTLQVAISLDASH